MCEEDLDMSLREGKLTLTSVPTSSPLSLGSLTTLKRKSREGIMSILPLSVA